MSGTALPKNRVTWRALRGRFAPNRPDRPPMQIDPSPPECAPPGMPPLAAADLQDHLMVASNDLDRLQRLLDDASQSLMGHFYGASGELKQLLHNATQYPEFIDSTRLHSAMEHLAGAITAMQFQDLASQLVTHTGRRLRNCADRLALEVMGDDDDGMTVVEDIPLRPNPVTQDEMDAGSIELF